VSLVLFSPQVLDLGADIDLVIGTDQPQLLDLDFQLGDWLFKVQVVGIHARDSLDGAGGRTVYKINLRQTNSLSPRWWLGVL
jgi:hypothetical protein